MEFIQDNGLSMFPYRAANWAILEVPQELLSLYLLHQAVTSPALLNLKFPKITKKVASNRTSKTRPIHNQLFYNGFDQVCNTNTWW